MVPNLTLRPGTERAVGLGRYDVARVRLRRPVASVSGAIQAPDLTLRVVRPGSPPRDPRAAPCIGSPGRTAGIGHTRWDYGGGSGAPGRKLAEFIT